MAQTVKNPPVMRETWVLSLHWEDTLKKGTTTHSSILAWRLPWTIQSMGSQNKAQDLLARFTEIYKVYKVSKFTEYLLRGFILKAVLRTSEKNKQIYPVWLN